MDMQEVKELSISEGGVKTIHDKDNRLLWSKVSYSIKYMGDTQQLNVPTPDAPQDVKVAVGEQTITITDGGNSQNYIVNLGLLELCKIGDYQDYIYKSGSDWYVHKTINGVTLNGSETWTGAGSVFQTSASSTPNKGDLWRDAYSNYFVHHYYPSAITSNIKNGEFGWNSAKLLTVRNDNVTGSANFKTWLSTHNLKVYYIRDSATETQITDSTLISQLDAVHQFLTRYGYNATVSGNLPMIIDKTNL